MAAKKDLERENEALRQQLAKTSKASSTARRLAEDAVREPIYEVRSIVNTTISAEITDTHGNKKRVLWPQKGAVQMLTAAQILEIQDHYDFFHNGELLAEGLIAPSINSVEDVDAFVQSLAPEQVTARVAEFDSTSPLFAIYHHIENKRLMDKAAVSPLESLVLLAVMQRLKVVADMNFSATDAD